MIKNQLKTVFLLGLLTSLLLFIGMSLGGKMGLLLGLIFAIGVNFASYWWSDKIVLKIYKAEKADTHRHAEYYSMVRDITTRAKVPMPRLYVVESPQANAFATGRNPKHAAIAVTTGILRLLNNQELKAVLAHEVGHIKNRDILISSVAATIAGVISYVAMMARWAAIFGGLGGRDRNSAGVVELLVLAIVAPLMAITIQFAISRSREFQADDTGARIIHDPMSLASALEKIHHSVEKHPLQKMGTTEATAHLFIEHPFKGKSLLNIFSTHPPLESRVKRLRAMKL